jgi:hypothetical protein
MRSPCNGRFRIIDISNPKAPADVAVMAFPQSAVGAVAIADHYAYVCVEGLRIFDVDSPTSPLDVGFLPSAGLGRPFNLAVDDGRAYYTGFSQTLRAQALHIADVSNPTAPAMINVWAFPSSGLAPQDLSVAGHYAYLAAKGCFTLDNTDCGNGLMVIDVADPESPVEVGHYVAPYPIPPPVPSPAP